MKHAAARFLVAGRVQGVFFRASTKRQARELGLSGHARNLDDGRVEVIAIGDAKAIDELQRWLRQGPPAAEVAHVVRDDVGIDSIVSTSGFRIA